MLDAGMTEWVLRHIAQPTVLGMAEEDTPFTGVLYVGLMMTARGPQVLEFNARFGDPEDPGHSDAPGKRSVDALEACIDGRLAETELRWTPGAAACVVASSSGYPGSYKTGLPITGLSDAARVPGVQVFHSGSKLEDGQVLTAEAVCWRDRGCRLTARGAGPRLRGDGIAALRRYLLSSRHRSSCPEEKAVALPRRRHEFFSNVIRRFADGVL